MFDFIVATNQGTEDHHITGASLYDEDGQVIGGVVFFAHKDMTMTSGEVVRPFSGKLNSVSFYHHSATLMRSQENDALFDAAGNITTIRR